MYTHGGCRCEACRAASREYQVKRWRELNHRQVSLDAGGLQALRIRHGYTRKKLAERVGVHHTQIGYWESGKNQPRPAKIRKLARIFRIKVEQLLVQETTA